MNDYEEDADSFEFEPEPDESDYGSGSGVDTRVELAIRVLRQVHSTMENVIELLETGSTAEGQRHLAELVTSKSELGKAIHASGSGKVVEGVFDGQNMIGSDGKMYTVPPNYASKSRLVEGDILKLVIKDDGAFVFKQIGPIERKRETGKVAYDAATGGYVVMASDGDETWKVLTASVTFYKGEPGDEAIVLVPKSTPTTWAAIENVIKR
ncbi:MAG: hypothetical protein ABIG32_02425 [Candidatus Uhrbacteria bacterium]|nr:hypothetical protein [Patescibacteria group bacterium]MBU1907468.1 hypothetical protein [Patescibacteria group bacterium]